MWYWSVVSSWPVMAGLGVMNSYLFYPQNQKTMLLYSIVGSGGERPRPVTYYFTCLLILINREDLIQSLQFFLHVKQLRIQGDGKTKELLSIGQFLTFLFKISELLSESLQQFHTWRKIVIEKL